MVVIARFKIGNRESLFWNEYWITAFSKAAFSLLPSFGGKRVWVQFKSKSISNVRKISLCFAISPKCSRGQISYSNIFDKIDKSIFLFTALNLSYFQCSASWIYLKIRNLATEGSGIVATLGLCTKAKIWKIERNHSSKGKKISN